MGEATKIQWTDHTFNAWWGCTRVSPGCENCYAETFDRRIGGDHWGPGKERRTFGEKHWREPLKWHRLACDQGRRHRVFCSSMADVFDAEAPPGELERLWALIRETPMLDWQLLTKRAERIAQSLPPDWGEHGYANVWLGVTTEDQTRAKMRVPILLRIPAKVHFVSAEPLLGEIDISPWLWHPAVGRPPFVDWVIVGGESGAGSRSFQLDWARRLIAQCHNRAAVFMKQVGSKPADGIEIAGGFDGQRPKRTPNRLKLVDPKGGDLSEWPEGLRVRQFPRGH